MKDQLIAVDGTSGARSILVHTSSFSLDVRFAGDSDICPMSIRNIYQCIHILTRKSRLTSDVFAILLRLAIHNTVISQSTKDKAYNDI
jgi:hypothetical protein